MLSGFKMQDNMNAYNTATDEPLKSSSRPPKKKSSSTATGNLKSLPKKGSNESIPMAANSSQGLILPAFTGSLTQPAIFSNNYIASSSGIQHTWSTTTGEVGQTEPPGFRSFVPQSFPVSLSASTRKRNRPEYEGLGNWKLKGYTNDPDSIFAEPKNHGPYSSAFRITDPPSTPDGALVQHIISLANASHSSATPVPRQQRSLSTAPSSRINKSRQSRRTSPSSAGSISPRYNGSPRPQYQHRQASLENSTSRGYDPVREALREATSSLPTITSSSCVARATQYTPPNFIAGISPIQISSGADTLQRLLEPTISSPVTTQPLLPEYRSIPRTGKSKSNAHTRYPHPSTPNTQYSQNVSSGSPTPNSERLLAILIDDRRYTNSEPQLAEFKIFMYTFRGEDSGLWVDAIDVCEKLQNSPSRIDGPAKVFTSRGKYRQCFLRISANNEDKYVSAHLAVTPQLALPVQVEWDSSAHFQAVYSSSPPRTQSTDSPSLTAASSPVITSSSNEDFTSEYFHAGDERNKPDTMSMTLSPTTSTTVYNDSESNVSTAVESNRIGK